MGPGTEGDHVLLLMAKFFAMDTEEATMFLVDEIVKRKVTELAVAIG